MKIGERTGAIFREFLRNDTIVPLWLPRIQADGKMYCVADKAFASGTAEFAEKKDALEYARRTRDEILRKREVQL